MKNVWEKFEMCKLSIKNCGMCITAWKVCENLIKFVWKCVRMCEKCVKLCKKCTRQWKYVKKCEECLPNALVSYWYTKFWCHMSTLGIPIMQEHSSMYSLFNLW